MKVKHEPNYISDKVQCFKVLGCTPGEYNVIKDTFEVLDAWLTNSSRGCMDSASEYDEFDFYLVMDSHNSMLFKLAYIADK